MSWNYNTDPPTLFDLNTPFVGNSSYNANLTLAPELNCFLKGSKILTESNVFVPIEELKDGDVIRTTYGTTKILKVLYRHVAGTHENLPYKIPKDFYSPTFPLEDTLLSPLHCIFHNNEWFCMCKSNFQKDESYLGKTLTYYHLLTEDYYKDFIICNNLVSETLKPCEENFKLYEECLRNSGLLLPQTSN